MLFMSILSLIAAVAINIIPQPQFVRQVDGEFVLADKPIYVDDAFGEMADCSIRSFSDQLSKVGAGRHTVRTFNSKAISGRGITFILDPDVPAQGYELEVARKSVVVRSGDDYGVLYAIQTIKQLLPSAVYSSQKENVHWAIPCCNIKDKPEFAYRGMHLDVARHVFSVNEIKKYLDVMAIFKINRFHWHLTDDQGWRIQIDSYPLLTEIGSWRDGTQVGLDVKSSDGIRYGGYYTKEQVREVVSYASSLGIETIPELDLPGHMLAALTAYPELGCTGGPYEVWQRWGISKDVLCAGNPEIYDFLCDIIDEMVELFPYEYFHIGGDECPKDRWKLCPKCQAKIKELGLESDEHASAEARLQNYVMAYIQDYLATKGKKVIGWDEILEGDLAEGTTIMSWRGVSGGVKAANRGFDVIMTPRDNMYFDYCQLPEKPEGFVGPRRMLPVEKVYSLDPYDQIEPSKRHHILGVQSNMWTEYIADDDYLEFQLLPRMLATSEVQWCSASNKDFERFFAVVQNKWYEIFDMMGYNYCRLPL